MDFSTGLWFAGEPQKPEKPIWERMREAADTYDEARKLLPKGYSPEYTFDPSSLRNFANSWEADAAKVQLRGQLRDIIKKEHESPFSTSTQIAAAILRHFDVTPKNPFV